MPAHEDRRQPDAEFVEPFLEIEPRGAWHPHVEDEAPRNVVPTGLKECLHGGVGNRHKANGAEQAHQSSSQGFIIVDDTDDRLALSILVDPTHQTTSLH
jgi:hypothetical protein